MDKTMIDCLKTIQTEFSDKNKKATLGVSDMTALAKMVDLGFSTPFLRKILDDKEVEKKIKLSGCETFEFDDASIEVVANVISCNGHASKSPSGVAIKKDLNFNNASSFFFNSDEVIGAILYNSKDVAVFRRHTVEPIHMRFVSDSNASAAFKILEEGADQNENKKEQR